MGNRLEKQKLCLISLNILDLFPKQPSSPNISPLKRRIPNLLCHLLTLSFFVGQYSYLSDTKICKIPSLCNIFIDMLYDDLVPKDRHMLAEY